MFPKDEDPLKNMPDWFAASVLRLLAFGAALVALLILWSVPQEAEGAKLKDCSAKSVLVLDLATARDKKRDKEEIKANVAKAAELIGIKNDIPELLGMVEWVYAQPQVSGEKLQESWMMWCYKNADVI